MIGRHLLVLLVTSLAFSVVLAGNSYFEHYFSKYHHHRKIPTTESISTTSSGGITSEEYVLSKENSSSEDDYKPNFTADRPPMHSWERNDLSYSFVAKVGTIVGGLVFIVLLLGCIVCCCPNCCRGTQTRGHVVPRQTEVVSRTVTVETIQQPVIIQHNPPEYPQDPVQQFPPQYQPPVLPPSQYAPVQQGFQYSPGQPQSPYSPVHPQTHYSPVNQVHPTTSPLQFYNPPEAPPPYQPTAPKM